MITRQRLFLISLLIVSISFSIKAQLAEDFSDGDFTNNPVWVSSNESGSGTDWQVVSNELQSNGPAASANIWISTPGVAGFATEQTQWQFKARYLTSGPSSSNRMTIYLVSDKADLNDSPSGYYIQLGETGSDDGIDFYKTTSSTPLISDSNPSVASGIDVNIRVSRSSDGLWTLEADPTGGMSFSTIGTVTDSEFTEGDHFGFLVTHTSTRNQDFYFDDISISLNDVTAPSVSAINVISSNELDIHFSEEVEIVSAENKSNYLVNNGIGAPSLAELDGADSMLVHLTFSTDFDNPSTNEITIANVADLSGNAVSGLVEEFMYFEEVPADFKDIIINEIMAAPNNENVLPNAEYIEVYNNSSKTFDLENWTFSDATSQVNLSSTFISPDEYLIICKAADAASFTPYGTVLGLSSFPTLNNSGDQLSLRTANGFLVDSVAYDDSWYNDETKDGGGWSLELINPNNLCGEEENWTASNSNEGGSPGTVNSVYDLNFDTFPPSITTGLALSQTVVELTFDERIDPASVDVINLSIDQGIEISSVTVDKNILLLTLTSTLEVNTTYEVSITGIRDCSGNELESVVTIDVIFVEGLTPAFKDIVINEIFADPTPPNDLPDSEFIELYNRSDKIFDLEGWIFADLSTQSMLPKIVMYPGEYIILCSANAASSYQPFGKTIGLSSWPSLNNGQDVLSIINNEGILVDQVAYLDDWYNSSLKQEGGWSLELIDPENECGEEENWVAADDPTGGTPGSINSVFAQNPDLTSPILVQAIAFTNDSLVLRFNEKLDTTQINNIQITTDPEVTISTLSFSNSFTEILIETENQIAPKTKYTVSITGVRDCTGNSIDSENNSATFGLIEPADSLDIVINEVLFNPRSGGEDFVEIYNVSDKYINLNNWMIANAEFEANNALTLNTIRTFAEYDLVLSPQDYLVLTGDNIVLIEQYPLGREDNFIELSSLPSYPNESGVVVLLNNNREAIDHFSYDESYHSPLLDNVDGISLERVSATENSNNPDNWKSAVAAVGYATPGYENSQSRSSVDAIAGELSISPKIIIPDGSGNNDFATIGYAFANSGNVGTMRILDVQGREVKIIAQNEFLGAEGFFTWDGTNQNGEQVRIGYYLVIFEVFDAQGGTHLIKEKIAVGSRF